MQKYTAPFDISIQNILKEQFDCLHDEGIAYAAALQAAGVSVLVEDVRGTFHGFDVFRKADLVKKQIEARSRALRTAFEKGA